MDGWMHGLMDGWMDPWEDLTIALFKGHQNGHFLRSYEGFDIKIVFYGENCFRWSNFELEQSQFEDFPFFGHG